MTVINSYGTEINFDVAVSMMDDEIREQICGTVDTDQEFFDSYCVAHEEKFGETLRRGLAAWSTVCARLCN